MENGTAVVTPGTEVKEGKEDKTPQEFAGQTSTVGLEAAVKTAVDRMRHCDEQIALWQTERTKVQTEVNEQLERIQKQFNGSPEAEKKPAVAPKVRFDKNATVPDLIRSYLEKNGPQRTKDIRKFLLAHGRKTNPGVALGRMVKHGDLKNIDRGVYKIA